MHDAGIYSVTRQLMGRWEPKVDLPGGGIKDGEQHKSWSCFHLCRSDVGQMGAGQVGVNTATRCSEEKLDKAQDSGWISDAWTQTIYAVCYTVLHQHLLASDGERELITLVNNV